MRTFLVGFAAGRPRRQFLTGVGAFCAALVLPLRSSPLAKTIYIDPRKDFIENLSAQGREVLLDTRLSRAEKEKRFRVLYRTYFDHEEIARSIVGVPWRGATNGERQKLNGLLDEYIIRLLVSTLYKFRKVPLEVTYVKESEQEKRIVVTTIAGLPEKRQYLNLDWHLRRDGTSFKIKDVYVEGVSLTLHERREFANLFKTVGSTVQSLIAAIGKRIEAIPWQG